MPHTLPRLVKGVWFLVFVTTVLTEHLKKQHTVKENELEEALSNNKLTYENYEGKDFVSYIENDGFTEQMLATFIQNMIDRFYHQREEGRTQFGFIILGNPTQNNLAITLVPHDAHDNPIVDNTHPISPQNPSNYVNYVAARPEDVPQLEDAIHAEDHILGELRRLWNNYLNRFGHTPTFMFLYSWVMPCQDCTQLILNYFLSEPYVNVQHRMVAHTTEGLYLPYMTREGNEESRRRLQAAGIDVFTHRCYSLPPVLSSHIIDERSNVFDSLIQPAKEKSGIFDQCVVSETLQGCLFSCLKDSICCCCQDHNSAAMTASYVNDFMSQCGGKDLKSCASSWINEAIGNACACQRRIVLLTKLRDCSKNCNVLPISNPLNPNNPSSFSGILQYMDNLKHFPTVSVSCNDKRMEGLLCSQYKAVFLTAGNSLCRQDSWCGYHGYEYSWCYTDYSKHWDYCCTDACASRGNNYLWCHSGSKWQYCGNAGTVNVRGRRCLPSSPCGLHLDVDSGTKNYWCYEDLHLNWQYCCQPTHPCETHGESYTWCYTGYQFMTSWQKCKKQ